MKNKCECRYYTDGTMGHISLCIIHWHCGACAIGVMDYEGSSDGNQFKLMCNNCCKELWVKPCNIKKPSKLVEIRERNVRVALPIPDGHILMDDIEYLLFIIDKDRITEQQNRSLRRSNESCKRTLGKYISAIAEIRNKTILWPKNESVIRLREIHRLAQKALDDEN